MQSHKIRIANVERDLPIRELPSGAKIAFLQLLGDLELCQAAATELVAVATSPCDLIATPESKGVPLAHELSRLTGAPYIVLRKSRKAYMGHPISEVVRSFTTIGPQRLWLDADEVAARAANHVWLVDDVATTGDTLRACEDLLVHAGARVAHRMVVMSEGSEIEKARDVISLGNLPIFDPATVGGTVLRPSDFHHRALDLTERWPLIYTALSKHQFCYRVIISKYVLERRAVPLNPAMVFDFAFHGLASKDTVITGNNNLIRAAAEVWVFGPISDGVLAEIILAEELGIPVHYFEIDSSWSIKEIDPASCSYEPELLKSNPSSV